MTAIGLKDYSRALKPLFFNFTSSPQPLLVVLVRCCPARSWTTGGPMGSRVANFRRTRRPTELCSAQNYSFLWSWGPHPLSLQSPGGCLPIKWVWSLVSFVAHPRIVTELDGPVSSNLEHLVSLFGSQSHPLSHPQGFSTFPHFFSS